VGVTRTLDEDQLRAVLELVHKMKADLDLLEGQLGAKVVERKPKKDPLLSPWLINNLLLFTFAWQLLNLLLIEVITFTVSETWRYDLDIVVVIMVLFQGLHLVVVIFTSIKLVKQIMHHTVSAWFIAQSFLSTILLFAGIYSLVYCLLLPPP